MAPEREISKNIRKAKAKGKNKKKFKNKTYNSRMK